MRPRPEPPDKSTVYPNALYQSRQHAWAQHRELDHEWLKELAEHPHVQEVMHIPGDEPIFVMRSQDIYSTDAVDGWISVASRTVSQEKFRAAATRLNEMLEWQNVEPTRAKIPD